MLERFTDGARAVVVDAQAEARRLQSWRIGTEHLLLALLRHGGGASGVLQEAGVTTDAVEAAIDRHLPDRPGSLGEEDAAALRTIGIDLDQVRARVEENFGPAALTPPPEPRRGFGWRRRTTPDGRPKGHIPFSPRAKKVLELSLREARRLQQDFIGAEHVLLGLLQEADGLAALILSENEVDFADLRRRTESSLRRAA